MNNNAYDVIVIGSGIGGLTTASLLSQIANKRVLVLESHFKLGGFTHSFRRKGYKWDVGLHYVGDMAPNSLSRQVMDMVTGGQVEWAKMENPIEHFVYPQHHLQVSSSEAEYKQALKSEFPKCSAEIDRYFRLIHRARGWVKRWTICKQFPKRFGRLATMPGRRLATRTIKDVLESTISDPQLRGMLVSQRGNYGLPPAQCAFGMHALVVSHYFEGGYVPVGGAERIAQTVESVIERNGGCCLARHGVVELIVEDRKVTKVVVERKGERICFEAPLVISAIGAPKTFGKLIAAEIDVPERRMLNTNVAPPTTVNVYVGLKDDPRKVGMDSGNYWFAEGYDHDAIAKNNQQMNGIQFGYGFLSSSSLRDATNEKHVAQIIFMSDYESWQRWADQPWLRRDDCYLNRKNEVAKLAIDLVERRLPGFRELVDYQEVSTPLSVEHCAGHCGGAIYGLPATPKRFEAGGFHVQTSIENLLLSGSDVGTFGIVGAMMSGLMTASWAVGPLGLPTVMRSVKKFARQRRSLSTADQPSELVADAV